MYKKIIYGTHTGEYRHMISEKEANRIKIKNGYGITDKVFEDKSLIKDGITFSIIENVKQYSTDSGNNNPIKYYLHIRVNHSVIIGENGNLIMELSPINNKKMITRMNKILNKSFQLEESCSYQLMMACA